MKAENDDGPTDVPHGGARPPGATSEGVARRRSLPVDELRSHLPEDFFDTLALEVERGVVGLVTDGVVRDVAGVLGTRLPVWCAGAAAPPSVAGLTFVGWQEPIGCGGCAVFPDDVIVADTDGTVVIPAAMVEEVAKLGPEQERLEAWIVAEVEKGEKLPGLYPPNEATKARYEADKKRGR